MVGPERFYSLEARSFALRNQQIGKWQGLGYKHPDPDELVAMRIHNVTPECVSGLRSRGIENLSIDHLVSVRIHGID